MNKNSSKNGCSKTGNDPSSGNQSSTSGNESRISRKENSKSENECSERSNSRDDTNIIPSYNTKPMAEIVESDWKDRVQNKWQNPITHDVKSLVKDMLIVDSNEQILNSLA
ncbi:hypothetical protein Tco_0599788 [Tanacetum coccineum]